MLDTATKRRIDSARDILVGKVPDPKSQVEQITIALIYKFMDDMDAESEELGGVRTFFTREFARYGWAKLMRSGLGGHETLNLYAEAISSMPENPGIPALFRSIFKNAYLPYRDPETLKSFLKIIDEFEYDHSERLGDAFEYLLSVLGSQGDAGQFRTPRHIIDFIVAVLDPKKEEKILDPACGTAGFLISAYKHILRANTDADGNSSLTPDDKGRLAQNINGYDISPDMVRLSLVNLYLHGFADPHIDEYDTLTSLDKWNEHADVILANPPFMSPKGGIKPHKRFSIQATRSEVLFVDYMAEHLKPNGRAGIIVPEGIIFQSGTAYKSLRKMLVDTGLVAVISLPAGVFQPYSGVKTSIIILDKSIAKRSNTIAFFKVDNDGFGLGAQRRAIVKNDLPKVTDEIAAYLGRLRRHESVEDLQLSQGLIVPKEKISENGDYNLSGERYGKKNRLIHAKWPNVLLGKICMFTTGGTPTSTVTEYYQNGTVPWLVSGDIHKMEILDCHKRITLKAVENSNARILPKDSVLIALNGQGKTRGTVALLRMEGATCNQSLVAITPTQSEVIISEFMFWVLRSMYSDIRALTGDNERSGLNIPILKSIQIPLPPQEVQKEIVTEIEGYQKVIDGARAVLDNYRPHIPNAPKWPIVELQQLCESIQNGLNVEQFDEIGKYKVTRIQTIADGTVNLEKTKWTNDNVSDDRFMQKGDILFSHINSIDHLAKTAIFKHSDEPVVHGINLIRLRPNQAVIDPYFMSWSMKQDSFIERAKSFAQRAVNQASIRTSDIRNIGIPLPPLETQQAIVAEIETEQALVAANRELIERFEKKIQSTIARVWDDDETTPAGEA